jgi:hypothetical protein
MQRDRRIRHERAATQRPRDDRADMTQWWKGAATMAAGDTGGGRAVAATFEGPLRSDAALTALREAGFRPEQVAVRVAPGAGGGGSGGGEDGAGARTIALIAGVVLGALIGAALGWRLADGTLALVLATVIGAAAGAAIAGALARAGGGAATASARTGPRPGSVTLTVSADSADQAERAREILTHGGGDARP